MSVQTKKRFKNLGKIIGVVLFVALMFTNIKVALMDDAEIASGDISVAGIEVTLFEAAFATERYNDDCGEICIIVPNSVCTYLIGYGYCSGEFG